jgi:hypothetical protein
MKTNELKAGDHVVLPADWPDGGEPRERAIVDEVSEGILGSNPGLVYVTVINEDRTGIEDDGIREMYLQDMPEELETW